MDLRLRKLIQNYLQQIIKVELIDIGDDRRRVENQFGPVKMFVDGL
jgi:hypothetical protein